MQFLDKKDYFPDFHYFRSSSPTYREYLAKCWLRTYKFDDGPQFWWIKNILVCHVITHDRVDTEPNIEQLKNEQKIRHALVVWIPSSRTDIPTWWRELWPSGHFKETWFCVLEDENYDKKWNERAKRAKKKFSTSWYIIKDVSPTEYVLAFKNTKVKHMYKKNFIEFYESLIKVDGKSMRQRLCYDPSGIPVAWLSVLDYLGNSTVHLTAFTGKWAYKCQWWTGLIDRRFSDSFKKNIKYVSFDQLRQSFWPKDQKWYTEFKENFIEYRMSFPKAYFKVF